MSYFTDYNNVTCAPGSVHALVGNGYCNDETNNADCNYDGGDCCLLDVNSEHCSECECYHQETCIAGVHPLVGDGFCHDGNNNADCNYDGGDDDGYDNDDDDVDDN